MKGSTGEPLKGVNPEVANGPIDNMFDAVRGVSPDEPVVGVLAPTVARVARMPPGTGMILPTRGEIKTCTHLEGNEEQG